MYFIYKNYRSLILIILIHIFNGCYEYEAVISSSDAKLKIIPRYNAYTIYEPEIGSIWKVLGYRHGWLKVVGPGLKVSTMDNLKKLKRDFEIKLKNFKLLPENFSLDNYNSTDEKTLNKIPGADISDEIKKKPTHIGWLRERDFNRLPVFNIDKIIKMEKIDNDVPIMWFTVPFVFIVLAMTLYFNNFFTRIIIAPLLCILLFFLSLKLVNEQKRRSKFGSAAFMKIGSYLKNHGGSRIYTTDDIWRKRLPFYMDYKPMANGYNSIRVLTKDRYLEYKGSYYLVVDPRLNWRIRWSAPEFVISGIYPDEWQLIKDYGMPKLFYIAEKLN